MRLKIRTLLLGAIIITIVPTFSIIAFFYNTSIRDLYQSRGQSYSDEIVKAAGENINTLLEQAWFTEKRLTSNVRTSQILLEYSGPLKKLEIISDIERLIWNYKESASYIQDIYLFSHDNRLYSTTTTTNLQSLQNAPWVTALSEPVEQGLISPTHSAYYDVPSSILSQNQQDRYVISFVRKVYHLGLEDKFSILQMDIKYAAIEKIMDNIDFGSDGYALVVNEAEEIIYCKDKAFLGQPLAAYFAAMGEAGGEHIQTEYTLADAGWRLLGFVSTDTIAQEFGSMNRAFVMAMAFSVLVAIVLSVVLSHGVTKPVSSLSKKMHKVGAGDFTVGAEKTYCEEMHQLNAHFARMVDEIDGLVHTVQTQEQEKANLEFQSLQNQINPHFLYNTLNTIKWMALMEENPEIAGAIVSLVKMLKFTYSDPGHTISIRDSIAFLRDYAAIQRLRYGGIEVEFAVDEELYDYGMLKFLLQPIMENAYIHGFPEGRGGNRITLEGHLEDGDILFTVRDNGVGMAGENAGRYSGLGIQNVQRRIGLHFGPDYGVEVQSAPGKGTAVTIRIPAIPWAGKPGEET